MELKTISQVSKAFKVSTRTLRYYEQLGLLKSQKTEEYAYRVYDSEAILCLQQIIILRKLRIPLKQISLIVRNRNASEALEVFRNNFQDISDEITALSTIRSILATFINTLERETEIELKFDLLNDEAILKVIDALTLTKINFKEEKSMKDLSKASEKLSKLTDVRIIYLPPATVAASHYIGEEPEKNSGEALDKFVKESGLCDIKPDLRHFGFNHPNPVDQNSIYGYETWVTIPDDMEVPAPLEKKKFEGGLYAAHMIQMGNFHEWEWLWEWVRSSSDYELNVIEDNGECMYGTMEEHLNYINHIKADIGGSEAMQLDLLIPVKEKNKK
ncbi:effector binding domain-containing protein [Clostridium oryzae]|uniref:Zinc-responsive transcriptional regulator n=1 Tax=Clostridium oryzae TaxID=1450648 RepID=A0A1V4IXX3_9CLOT|nr:effector binding domain-containing protein [Clostridium oryzae]OPJ64624.1 zinc-responsive transcriptional regulator [Clostridium oryzae]